ncbi:MAG: R3H domain-containing nucleic acid-binding protein [Dehalococcoidia bacterium]|nr:R3H domain-containing nucleic acid-binding protein [Dehalococcoidia bacterium]
MVNIPEGILQQQVITDDLNALIDILPEHISRPLYQQNDISDLIEVVLDLGRPPEVRLTQREFAITSKEVTELDIEYVVSRVSSFGDDNRAGIPRTLHRISAIRNRQGSIVGLTCRVGRAVFGTIRIIEDLVRTGKSILLLGRPGVGKTTMLREVARVLADDLLKRVIVVDTSNEIAGDGDIPHPAIGHARRMQVATPTMQHAVMIEAVENHMPQVIVIDEIGTELEAQAARTIAERGVQLIGTAHGNTLDNLIINPTLHDLIGGIQTVTLGDEEAKRRGTQKSILERMSPPTFDIVVEIQDRNKVAIHPDVIAAVDSLLRGRPLETEIRYLDEKGEVQIVKEVPGAMSRKPVKGKRAREEKKPRLYLFGVNRSRLEQATKEMQVNLDIVNNPRNADVFITSKSYYRQKPQKLRDAEIANIPVYVLKNNTPTQMRQLISTLHPSYGASEEESLRFALDEAEEAVSRVRSGQELVELRPQSSYIRRLQHQIAEHSDLASESLGKDPNRRVRIFRHTVSV